MTEHMVCPRLVYTLLPEWVGGLTCYIPGKVYPDGKYERSDDDSLYIEGTLERGVGGGYYIGDTHIDLSRVLNYEYFEGALILYYV